MAVAGDGESEEREIDAGEVNGGDKQSIINAMAGMNRKEKRKTLKKIKRKQLRRERAIKEREEEESRLNDPEEQMRLLRLEQEEVERMERDRFEFEEREKRFLMELERKKKLQEEKEEEERNRKVDDDESQSKLVDNENTNELNEGDEWEYVEEGPAEIIWKGNEIIVKKKKVRVPKKDRVLPIEKQESERPISNPLAPQSEAYEDYRSAQEVLESVAQQVPNFGTEQDKAHCPFHLKTGVCRFGARCSRVHFYPDKSCTLLMKNMYNGPGLAFEQDEGLEISCEFVNVTRWKVAICGEYMKSRLKTCSRGSACNFIHCFRNPGGDYEWADLDKPAPRYWLKKMAALFGCPTDRFGSESSPGYRSRRSRSRGSDSGNFSDEDDDRKRGCLRKRRVYDRGASYHDEDMLEDKRISYNDYHIKHCDNSDISDRDSNDRKFSTGTMRSSRKRERDPESTRRSSKSRRHGDYSDRKECSQKGVSGRYLEHKKRMSDYICSRHKGSGKDYNSDLKENPNIDNHGDNRHKGGDSLSKRQKEKSSDIDSDGDRLGKGEDSRHRHRKKNSRTTKEEAESSDSGSHGGSYGRDEKSHQKNSRVSRSKSGIADADSNREKLEKEVEHHRHRRRSSRHHSKDKFEISSADGDREKLEKEEKHHRHRRRSSRHHSKDKFGIPDADSDREKLEKEEEHHRHRRRSSRCHSKDKMAKVDSDAYRCSVDGDKPKEKEEAFCSNGSHLIRKNNRADLDGSRSDEDKVDGMPQTSSCPNPVSCVTDLGFQDDKSSRYCEGDKFHDSCTEGCKSERRHKSCGQQRSQISSESNENNALSHEAGAVDRQFSSQGIYRQSETELEQAYRLAALKKLEEMKKFKDTPVENSKHNETREIDSHDNLLQDTEVGEDMKKLLCSSKVDRDAASTKRRRI